MRYSEDQRKAKKAIEDWIGTPRGAPLWLTLGGYAGTGKTTLVADVRRGLSHRRKVAFCAFTGKAAAVLKSKLEAVSALGPDDYIGTLHSLCYRVQEDHETGLKVFRPKTMLDDDYSLIVVDEASMVNQELFNDLRSFRVPMLFVGDHGQLPPVSQDSFNLMEKPDLRLEEVHRFGPDSALLDVSVLARTTGRLPYQTWSDKVAKVHGTDPAVDSFLVNRLGDFSDGICLCGTNSVRVSLNQQIRLGKGVISSLGDKVPRAGDRVVCLKNNKQLVRPIFNGMLGSMAEVRSIDGLPEVYSLDVDMDEGFGYSGMAVRASFGRERRPTGMNVQVDREFVTLRELLEMKEWLSPKEKRAMRRAGKKRLYFDQFDFGYCLTVHKAQGSEWGNVMVFEDGLSWDEEYRAKWLYTAVTRSSDRLLVVD